MKLFKSYSEKEVKRIKPIVAKINSYEEELAKLSDSELVAKTPYFKEQLKNGKTIINNNEYEMSQHGFARDMEFEEMEQNK